MKNPITDSERERGLVKVYLLPSQVEAIDRLLEPRGFEFSPPLLFGADDDETERMLVATEETAKRWSREQT